MTGALALKAELHSIEESPFFFIAEKFPKVVLIPFDSIHYNHAQTASAGISML